jgi:hypothetical protein
MRRQSIVNLLVLASLYWLILILQTVVSFYKTNYLNEEVICAEPSPSVGVLSIE